LCGRSPRAAGAVGERLSAIQLEQDEADEALDFAAQAKAPMASAGAKPRAKARIRIQKLVEKFPVQARLIRGSFEDCCSTVQQASFVLTLDSAPVHIASFYGVRTISVFTSGRERKWAPLAPESITLKRGNLPCQPCTLFGQVPPCPNSYACKDIDLES